MLFESAVSALRSAEGAGFDVSEPRVAEVVNEAIGRLAAYSQWIEERVELGPTVIGQHTYDLPDRVIDVSALYVGGAKYGFRASEAQMLDIQAGTLEVVNTDGAFAPATTSTGQKRLTISPTPTAAGTAIIALAAVLPATALETGDTLPFPEDHSRTVINFAKAILYEEVDENQAEAEGYEAKALRRAEDLRRRRYSRVGSGAQQAQIAGVHF